jgi:hypothetical protein
MGVVKPSECGEAAAVAGLAAPAVRLTATAASAPISATVATAIVNAVHEAFSIAATAKWAGRVSLGWVTG